MSQQGQAASPAEGRFRGLLRNMSGALKLCWQAGPGGFLAMVALSAVGGVVPPVLLWLGKLLVDAVAAGAAGADVAVWRIVTVMATVAAAGRALVIVQQHRQAMFADRVSLHADHRLLRETATCDLGYFDDSEWLNKLDRAREGAQYRPVQMAYSLVGLVSVGVTLVGMFGVIAGLHPVLLLLTGLSVVPSMILTARVNSRLYAFFFAMTPDRRARYYLRHILASPSPAKELRAFNLSSHLLDRHYRSAHDEYVAQARLYRRADLDAITTAVLSGAAIGAAYFFVAREGVAGRLTVGDLTALIGAVGGVAQAIGLLISTLAMLDQHGAFLRDYFSFLDQPALLTVRSEPVELRPQPVQTIEIDGVSFRYPGGENLAVDGVTLTLRRGEMLALVGINGSGKTTLVKLLLRAYDPTAGAIRFDGVDLRDLEPAAVRDRVGVLFQDYVAYELTARENVSFGRAQREDVDDVAVRDALEAARATEVVEGLRDGLDSAVGRVLEGGHDLSGGQWQRLALARLHYRDADIWILDEPTASLDAEAEAAVFAELHDVLADRIGLVISHRFSTVRNADRIAVLDRGRLIEYGTHDELLLQAGKYAELFDLQAAGYR